MSCKYFKRAAAVMAAAVMSLTALGGAYAVADTDFEAQIAELERKRAELQKEREEIESSIQAYEANAAEHEKYLEMYDEKMKLQEEEIDNIKKQIALLDDDIADMEVTIGEKQQEVDESIEDFKQRLRVMYMTGNDSLASMLVGSTDFYDILTRMELVERISRHDNDMIDDLNAKIGELELYLSELEQSKLAAEKKREDATAVLEQLQETYRDHEETKEWYETQAQMDRERTAELDEQEELYEQQLQEFIRKQQEENERKRKEEEERRERERQEQERLKREEEERKRLEAEAQGVEYVPEETDSSSDTDTYTYVTGASQGFIWPCPTVLNMTDTYGSRYIVEEGRNDFHKGIDITKPGCAGEPIVASAAGTVITASNTGNGYGIHVVIDHGDKIATLYGHMSSCAVNVGDEVEQGQTIGYIGCTGYAYGNHCHFEVRVNGQHTDPLNYVSMG